MKIKIAQASFFFNAVIWLVFGVYTLTSMAGRYPERPVMAYGIGIMMLGNIAAMFLSGLLLGWRNKWFYYFGLFILLVNIILTITDQFGVFDLITLIIDLFLFLYLIIIRRYFLAHEAIS